jgi:hypothetical protein
MWTIENLSVYYVFFTLLFFLNYVLFVIICQMVGTEKTSIDVPSK